MSGELKKKYFNSIFMAEMMLADDKDKAFEINIESL